MSSIPKDKSSISSEILKSKKLNSNNISSLVDKKNNLHSKDRISIINKKNKITKAYRNHLNLKTVKKLKFK